MEGGERIEDAVIVGAGPIGLACAISARRRGVDPLVVDAGAICDAIVRYPIGMSFFTTPERLEIGGNPMVCSGKKPTREEALMYYRGVARSEEVRVRPYTLLLEAARAGDGLECRMETRHGPERIRCSRLVLATGYYDHPNMMGVAGEELPHVHHYFDEAHRSSGQRVVVIGGKNSAVEAALELFRAGARVTLVYRRSDFRPSVKYWMVPDIGNRIAAGEIEARFGAEVMGIEQTCVIIRTGDGSPEELPCDRVYALTGYRPDFDLFRRVGIELDPETCAPAMNPETHETNVPGVYMAGSITTGWDTSDVFIENGRFDGEKIFADVVRGC